MPQVYQEDCGLYYFISSLLLFNIKIVILKFFLSNIYYIGAIFH